MIINGSKLLEAAPIVDMFHDKRTNGLSSYGLAEAGYDIRVKQDIHFADRILNTPNGVKTLMVAHVGGEIVGEKFCRASTMEEFRMPTSLMAVVHDKSTWARHGLSVFNTVIEPGWRGWLTLELVYHGKSELFIPAGSGIAQVMFHELAVDGYYTGKYQDQADRPVEAILA